MLVLRKHPQTGQPDREELDRKMTEILGQKGALEALLKVLNGPSIASNQRIFIADLHANPEGARVAQHLSGKRYGGESKDHHNPIIVKCTPEYDRLKGRYTLIPVTPGTKGEEELTADLDGMTVLGEVRTRPTDDRPRIHIARIARLPKEVVETQYALAKELERESAAVAEPVLPKAEQPKAEKPKSIELRRTEREEDLANALSLLFDDTTDAASRDAYTRIVKYLNGPVNGNQRILLAYMRVSGDDVGVDPALDGTDFGKAIDVTNFDLIRGTLHRHRNAEGGFEMRMDPSTGLRFTENDSDRLVLAKLGTPDADGKFPVAIARLDQLDDKDGSTIASIVAAALPPDEILTRIPSNQVSQHNQLGQGSESAEAEEPEPSKV